MYNLQMSLLRGIKESRKVEDLNKLKLLIVKFEKHLRSTNEKLANLRNLIRTESNIKTRKTHLKKSHTLVWEQHTLRNILIDYRKKLEILDAKQTKEKQQAQLPAKNKKLFELFDDLEPRNTTIEDIKADYDLEDSEEDEKQDPLGFIVIENKNSSVKNLEKIKAIQDKRKKRKLSEEVTPAPTEEKDLSPRHVIVNTQDEVVQHLKALQEYAMLNENFRATGLLLEAEKAFLNPPTCIDFEL